jgi:hypothetical protein
MKGDRIAADNSQNKILRNESTTTMTNIEGVRCRGVVLAQDAITQSNENHNYEE